MESGKDSNHYKLIFPFLLELPSSSKFLFRGNELVFDEGLLVSRLYIFFPLNLYQSPLR